MGKNYWSKNTTEVVEEIKSRYNTDEYHEMSVKSTHLKEKVYPSLGRFKRVKKQQGHGTYQCMRE